MSDTYALVLECRDQIRALLTAVQECRAHMVTEPEHWQEMVLGARALIVELDLWLNNAANN